MNNEEDTFLFRSSEPRSLQLCEYPIYSLG